MARRAAVVLSSPGAGMKVVTAAVGAAVVFLVSLVVWGLLGPHLPEFPRPQVLLFWLPGVVASPDWRLLTGNLTALLVALLLALASYHATLRYHERQAGGAR